MERRFNKLMVGLALLALIVGLGGQAAWAESNLGVGAAAAPQARLQFAIQIPTILYLKVGTAGATIDTVTFDLNGITTSSGSVAGIPTVACAAIAILSAGQNAQVTVQATTDFSGGTGTKPLFSKIAYSGGTGIFGGSGNLPNFGAAAVQLGTRGSSGAETCTYTFSFNYDIETDAFGAGSWTGGQITYTLSLT